jgi:serine/threonine-protein kinase
VAGAIVSGGRLKDRYRLERTLGRGGMAAVWLGHDELLDRPVAVKVLSDTIASDPSFVARFRREARTAAGLSHPNLVGVYDFSDEEERPYLVMQLVPGEDLASTLERRDRVDCDRLARELLDALAHIHEAGILHRDIKPGNVIVEPDGTTKLIDFGIALPRDATALTSTGLVLGTERYAAPEVMEGRPATERSDLYSCGLVLQSCEGERSRALRALVAAMAAKDPGDRPLSAEHAREQLEQLERPALAAEPPTEVLHPPPARPSSGSGRDRRKIAVAILGLLAAAAIVAVVASGGGDDPVGGEARQAAQAKESKGEGAAARGSAADSQAARPEPSATDPARGATLNEQGFAMIQAGEFEAAVPVLEEAVGSFPEGADELEYAYALFNLGNALRLSGRPEEAIPVLERRLEIPNQEGEVRKELEVAQAEAGVPTSFEQDD